MAPNYPTNTRYVSTLSSDFLAPAKKSEEDKVFVPRFVDSVVSSQTGYTSGGNPDNPCPEVPIDDPTCYAKKVSVDNGGDNRTKYYVKVGPNGFMFDPWGLYSEGTQRKVDKLAGRDTWSFKEVNAKAFEYYVKFLQSRNSAWKNNAEREYKNA